LFDQAQTELWASIPKKRDPETIGPALRETVPIMGDSGYVKQSRKCLIASFKHYSMRDDDRVMRHHVLRPEQRGWNVKVAKARIMVERTNLAVKGWLQILGSGASPGQHFKMDIVVRIAVRLTNWRARRHPLVAKLGPAP
jgi:hypothetical protein